VPHGNLFRRTTGNQVPWSSSYKIDGAGADGLVVKAQVLSGGRGKSGLVRVVPVAEAAAAASDICRLLEAAGQAPLVLIEEKVTLVGEYYLACRIDDLEQSIELMFSLHGGVDIESHADMLHRRRIDPLAGVQAYKLIPFFRDAGVNGPTLGPLCRLAVQVHRALIAEDAELIEINPLGVQEGGRLIALDAKVTLDDNAAKRHENRKGLVSADLADSEMTDLERRGAAAGLTFVELEGDVALMTGGAGLGMMMADLLDDNGWKAANFVDSTSGSSPEVVRTRTQLVFERASRDDVRAILVYWTISASPLERIVKGLLQMLGETPPPKPMVIGLAAAGAATANLPVDEARRLIREAGYTCVEGPGEVIEELRKIAPPRR